MSNLQNVFGEQGFDSSQVKPSEGFTPLPAGDYIVMITDSEVKPTQDGNGQLLGLIMQVIRGEFQNRKLFENLNLINASPQAQEIARGTLSAICRACGIGTVNDSSQLHNIPMQVRVAIKKRKDTGNLENTIQSYKPAGPPPNANATGAQQPQTNQPVNMQSKW